MDSKNERVQSRPRLTLKQAVNRTRYWISESPHLATFGLILATMSGGGVLIVGYTNNPEMIAETKKRRAEETIERGHNSAERIQYFIDHRTGTCYAGVTDAHAINSLRPVSNIPCSRVQHLLLNPSPE